MRQRRSHSKCAKRSSTAVGTRHTTRSPPSIIGPGHSSLVTRLVTRLVGRHHSCLGLGLGRSENTAPRRRRSSILVPRLVVPRASGCPRGTKEKNSPLAHWFVLELFVSELIRTLRTLPNYRLEDSSLSRWYQPRQIRTIEMRKVRSGEVLS